VKVAALPKKEVSKNPSKAPGPPRLIAMIGATIVEIPNVVDIAVKRALWGKIMDEELLLLLKKELFNILKSIFK